MNMKKAGHDDELIISRIQQTKTHINLTINQIITLKRKGFSDAIIRELLKKPAGSEVQLTATPSPQQRELKTPVVTLERTEKPKPEDTLPAVRFNDQDHSRKKIVKVTTTPSQADVYLDDLLVGVTPYYTNMVLDGKHSLIIKKHYYKDIRVEIDLIEESIQNLHLDLKLERPTILVTWIMDNESSLKDFGWSIRNCTVQDVQNAPQIIQASEEVKNNETVLFVEPGGEQSLPEDTVCLECLVWLESHLNPSTFRGDRMPSPDLLFLINKIPISYQLPVEVRLELHRSKNFPQGIRIILHSGSGQLFRLNPHQL
ncbi:PEGA domain-containing protein [candidate division CSSED10-310 bacterium]|uniref:PEGA domain-containing protein n=1 Tax=candidate division CSSED10-310 bacterium TaxID=2855610 RepID=A0ABV6YTB5_UNCC1